MLERHVSRDSGGFQRTQFVGLVNQLDTELFR